MTAGKSQETSRVDRDPILSPRLHDAAETFQAARNPRAVAVPRTGPGTRRI